MNAERLMADVARRGFAHVTGSPGITAYREFASSLGEMVGEEVIELRDGAHAYVAKPGPVPLHTDHPQVELATWYCVEQDTTDGASWLLDASSTIASYSHDERERLRRTDVCCPPVAGGPPTQRFPVLRRSLHGPHRDLLFCSPWMQAAHSYPEHQEALNDLRRRLADAARTEIFEVRLAPGDMLIVDNQRMLHGRGAISQSSRRRLLRLWLITAETAALE